MPPPRHVGILVPPATLNARYVPQRGGASPAPLPHRAHARPALPSLPSLAPRPTVASGQLAASSSFIPP